jgi:hypothetical protein
VEHVTRMEGGCSYRHVTISAEGKRLFGVCIVYAVTRKVGQKSVFCVNLFPSMYIAYY